MFRICEIYGFDLVGDGPDTTIPCQIEITSRRDGPDIDPCNPIVDPTNDARLSMVTRGVITARIAEELNGHSIDGPILDLHTTDHAPERIAVWAYWLARDQSRYEREITGWQLTIESARVVSDGRWMVEYAPTSGDLTR
jgi:hypothetical protein